MKFEQKYVDIIKEFVAKNNGILNGKKLSVFLKNNLEVKQYYESILKQYPNFVQLYNVVWASINNFDIDNYKCKFCGKPLVLKNVTLPREYCGVKCSANDPELKERTKQTIASDPDHWKKRREKTEKTNMQKYGTKAPAQNEQVKKKAKQTISKDPDHWKKRTEKIKKTNLQKYGVENVSQAEQIKQKKIKTSLEHFGVEHPAQLKEIQQKVMKTCVEKYGVDCQFKREEVRQYSWNKSWETIQKWKDYVIPLFTKDEYKGYNGEYLYKWKCVKCGNEFEQYIHHTKHTSLSEMIPRCYNCYPTKPTSSAREKVLVDYIKTIYNGEIIQNDRSLIAPKELDIVLPDKKIVIEFNGIYWHCDKHNRIDQNYHLEKTLACEEKGYKLIHIFENEWFTKKQIIQEKLKSIICNDIPSIYARNCEIKEVSISNCQYFLNRYHLQGEDKSNVKLGLYYQNELVAVMTFCKPRFNKKYEWELSRYATSKRVIGGAGKLLAYFRNNYSPKSIITYCDRRFSTGNMYQKIGFKLDHISEPNYWWTKNDTVLSRYECQKSKLKKILGDKYDPQLSEVENMSFNGYSRIFDCGNLVYVLE